MSNLLNKADDNCNSTMKNATHLLNVLRKITLKLYISVLAMNNVLFKCLLYQNVSITFVYTASAALQQERVCDSFFT